MHDATVLLLQDGDAARGDERMRGARLPEPLVRARPDQPNLADQPRFAAAARRVYGHGRHGPNRMTSHGRWGVLLGCLPSKAKRLTFQVYRPRNQ